MSALTRVLYSQPSAVSLSRFFHSFHGCDPYVPAGNTLSSITLYSHSHTVHSHTNHTALSLTTQTQCAWWHTFSIS